MVDTGSGVGGGNGNHDQIRLIAEAMAESMAVKFLRSAEDKPVAEVPAPLKWAGAIIAGLFTAGTATLAFWIVTSVSEMQVTLARMDERLASQADGQDMRFLDHERRIRQLEAYHQDGAR